MKKENSKVTNNQTAQKQAAEQTACSMDMKESVQSWLSLMCSGKYYLEIFHMLRMAVTSDYLKGLNMQNLPEPEVASSELLQKTADAFRALSEIFAEKTGLTPELDIPDRLTSYQVAKLIQVFFHAIIVPDSEIYMDEETYDENTVMVYVDEKSVERGSFEYSDIGTYTMEISPMVSWFCPQVDFDSLEFLYLLSEVKFWLEIFAEKVSVSDNITEFIPLMNGILDCRTKKLIPFSPEHIFTDKFLSEYVESGNGPVIQRFYGSPDPCTVDDWLDKVMRARAEDSMDGD